MRDHLVGRPQSSRPLHIVDCGWFWAWAIVGCAGVLGAISLGPILVLPVALAIVFLARHRIARRAWFGALTGGGALLLYVAYVQRDGPGTTCWQTATSGGCAEHLDPRPWLVAGCVLVIAGIVAQVLVNRYRSSRSA
jgi:hypothetical protein